MKSARFLNSALYCALMSTATFAVAEGTSPWLPIPGQLSASIGYIDQSGDSAYIGDQDLSAESITGNAADEFEQTVTTLSLNYGIADNLSVDATFAYSEVDVGSADSDRGLADSVVGLNWRVVDEFFDTGMPTVTLRAAAIIGGNYDGARLAAIGKDANGIELAAVVGKSLTPWMALSAEVGWQDRDNGVPNASFFELTSHFTPAPGWSMSLGYLEKDFDSSLDIGEEGFSPQRFQEVAEERSLIKASVGYGFGNQGVALMYNELIDGRNTVDDSFFGISYTYAF